MILTSFCYGHKETFEVIEGTKSSTRLALVHAQEKTVGKRVPSERKNGEAKLEA